MFLEEKEKLFWKHQPGINDAGIKYAFVLTGGGDLSRYSHDPDKYRKYRKKIISQKKAIKKAKMSIENAHISDAIPDSILRKWKILKTQALANAGKIIPETSDYEILHKAHVLVSEISNHQILFNGEKKIINFDIFGTVTGRLTTVKNSFPVLTLKKENRFKITPQNDAFVELDLNAAEVRTLMALSAMPQPEQDIHEYLMSKAQGSFQNRSSFKERLFAWLYNPNSVDQIFDELLSKNTYLDFYDHETKTLATPFGRNIKVEEKKAQNYLLQSTTSDIVICNAYKILKLLSGKNTKIAFTLHDSIILDFCKEDIHLLKKIKSTFEQTEWGLFKSTCKVGRNFGSLKEMKI